MGCSESKIDNISAVNQCKQRTAFMKQSVSAYTAFVSAHYAYTVALNNTATALSDYAQSELGDGGGEGQLPSSMAENVNLMKVFGELGDGFIETSNSAYKALQVHEANKLLANNQGHFEHSIARVLKGGKVDFSSKEKETHATLLDKMLAWEKKLYDQEKDGEKIKHKYQKKMASLDNKRKRGVSRDRLKQREATVNHLHATYAVEMQSIDSTVTEINRLRDQHMYPKLVQIVEKMGEMWTDMREQHEQQSAIVQRLINNSIKISQLPSDNNPKNMGQIHLKLTIWCSEFENLILHQKEYFKSLNNWLKLNPISTHNNMKPQNPKITSLLRAWNDEIPETRAKAAINSLAAAIAHNQSHAMKLQENCDGIRREIEKKTREFEMDDVDVIAEQQVVVEAEEVCRRYGVQVMEKSVVEMMAALTEVFTAMAEYAGGCLSMFGNLKSQ